MKTSSEIQLKASLLYVHQHKVDSRYLVTFLLGHLDLSGMWFGVAPRIDTKKMCLKGIRLRAQNMITILGLIVHKTGRTYMTI